MSNPFHRTDWILPALCGTACLAIDLLGTFGAAFTDVGLAGAAICFVDIPIFVSLAGSTSRRLSFPVLGMFGSALVVIGVLSIYARDFANSHAATGFLLEGASWCYLLLNLLNFIVLGARFSSLRRDSEAWV
jgi:hypothetical protein